jgi:hypothetical protein
LRYFFSLFLFCCLESCSFGFAYKFFCQYVLRIKFVLEILIFFVFSAFVVFGIKGFFEMYSQNQQNAIIFISGILLAFVIVILCYQILFQVGPYFWSFI